MTRWSTPPGILATALLVAAIPLGTGCGRPVPQVARENFRYAQALRTAANSRDASGFETVARTIERDAQAGRIAADEQAVYEEIVALGRAERFADAEQRCLAFLREQARR